MITSICRRTTTASVPFIRRDCVEYSSNKCSVMDPDPVRVGSASFCWIRIGINAGHMKNMKYDTHFFNKISVCCPKYGT